MASVRPEHTVAPSLSGADGARDAALRLLARREYSTAEMRRKLTARGLSVAGIDAVLAALEHERLLCDHRFAESLSRLRIDRGHGPVRIRAELRERGVADEVIGEVITQTAEFWLVRARRVLAKRYGHDGRCGHTRLSLQESREEWTRRARFLAQRGFPSDLIYRALGSDDD